MIALLTNIKITYNLNNYNSTIYYGAFHYEET